MRSLIMREMHWDYWTYCNQPEFVIEQLIMFFQSETQGHARAQASPKAGVR